MKNMVGSNLFWIALVLVLVSLVIIIGCQVAVISASRGRMYSDVKEIPHREVGLLLGTSPKGRTGRPNQFFLRRIDAAVKLYEADKIDRLIISGARHSQWYDEPEAMRKALVGRGLPDSILVLDGEGFRTLASIVRAKDEYGVSSLTIISQKFHNERAIFMAKHNGIDAIAFNAANTSSRKWRLFMMLRECASRVKAVLEVLRTKITDKTDSI